MRKIPAIAWKIALAMTLPGMSASQGMENLSDNPLPSADIEAIKREQLKIGTSNGHENVRLVDEYGKRISVNKRPSVQTYTQWTLNRGEPFQTIDPLDTDNPFIEMVAQGHGPLTVPGAALSGRHRKCSDLVKRMPRGSDGYPLVRNKKNLFLTDNGKAYFHNCFRSIDSSDVDNQIRYWAKRRVGVLFDPGSIGSCVITFINSQLAVTANHCLLRDLDHSKVNVGGFDLDSNQQPGWWAREGVQIVKRGCGDKAPEQSSKKPTECSPSTVEEDYVYIKPLTGDWPVELQATSLQWDPSRDYDGQQMHTFTWLDQGDFQGHDLTGDWLLFVDNTPSCVIFYQHEKRNHGLHRCQAVRGSSGTLVVSFSADDEGLVSGDAFGIHTGPASLNGYGSEFPGNLVIMLFGEV